MKYADLHTHTRFSDGTSTPEELILEARSSGLDAIALVDHDSVEGIAAASKAAEENGIELIPGIELSTEYESLEVHILGYLIDYKSPKLIAKLNFLKENRLERIHKMVERLKGMGIELNPQSVLDISGAGTTGRMHIAQAMVNQRLVSSTAEAFAKFIGDKSPAYICGFKLSPLEAITLIKETGGIAVLAHPYLFRRDEMIPQFVEYGLRGLEVYYPEHTQSMINFYLALAKQYNLLVTGGSDFHGRLKPGVKLGATKIPYELVEALKKAKP